MSMIRLNHIQTLWSQIIHLIELLYHVCSMHDIKHNLPDAQEVHSWLSCLTKLYIKRQLKDISMSRASFKFSCVRQAIFYDINLLFKWQQHIFIRSVFYCATIFIMVILDRTASTHVWNMMPWHNMRHKLYFHDIYKTHLFSTVCY